MVKKKTVTKGSVGDNRKVVPGVCEDGKDVVTKGAKGKSVWLPFEILQEIFKWVYETEGEKEYGGGLM